MIERRGAADVELRQRCWFRGCSNTTPALRRRKNLLRTVVSNRDGREGPAAFYAPTLDMRTLCTLSIVPYM